MNLGPRRLDMQTERTIAKLLSDLDARSPRNGRTATADSAARCPRPFWNELVMIWIDLGGPETGRPGGHFLFAASSRCSTG